MFSETSFLLVFGLGAACILLGFVLVLRGVGASDSESTVKLIGIELRASRVGPGVLFALFGLVLVITAMAKLNDAPAETTPAAPATVTTADPAPQAEVRPAAQPGPGDLVSALAARNVHSSEGEARLSEWMTPGSHYQRLGEATLAALGSRRLTGAGVDLLKVNYFYLVERGVTDEAQLPAGQPIDRPALERAILLAHKDMNGGSAASLADIAHR